MKEAIAAFVSQAQIVEIAEKIAYSHEKQEVRVFGGSGDILAKYTYEEIKQWFYANHVSYPQATIINDRVERNFVSTYNGEPAW